MVERGGLPKARSVLLIAERGAPRAILSDNGRAGVHLAASSGMVIREGDPSRAHQAGKPVQNAYVESFHGKSRDECLNAS